MFLFALKFNCKRGQLKKKNQNLVISKSGKKVIVKFEVENCEHLRHNFEVEN